ncbi:MAG: nucleoside deaminase [Prevotellaceae bacterium]|jgi:tRNA(Arg) A34 adenosine deaminase TadA|nr:nucleoside deaminase [Prevotellaceae bacterium]
MNSSYFFLRDAIELADENITQQGGGPFGAVIVKDGAVVARAVNTVTTGNDPTAHAEVNAIRAACRALNTFDLSGCTIYCSCEPCPMCLAAVYWARIERIYYAGTRIDAQEAGFDDSFIYEELERPLPERKIPIVQQLGDEGAKPLQRWKRTENKTHY